MSDGGFMSRSPSPSFGSTHASGPSVGQSRAEPELTPQQRDDAHARAELDRANRIAGRVAQLDKVPAARWDAEREALSQELEAFAAHLTSPAGATPSQRATDDRAATTEAVKQARKAIEDAKRPRAVPPVAGEVEIEPRIIDKSIAPADVVFWMAGLSRVERSAVWTRYTRREPQDAFALAFANYVSAHRDRKPPLSKDLGDIARMKDDQLAEWHADNAAVDAAEPAEPIANGSSTAPATAAPLTVDPFSGLTTATTATTGPARPPPAQDPIVSSARSEAQRLPARIRSLTDTSHHFAAARDRLDGDSVGALGIQLAAAYESTAASLARLTEGLDNAELLGAVGVDYSWDPTGDKANTRDAEVVGLQEARADLTVDLHSRTTLIANTVRPSWFRRREVPGVAWEQQSADMPRFIREESIRSILLIDTLDEIGRMMAGAKGQPPDVAAALRKEAANRLQFWLSDHDGFLFLGQALGVLGHGDVLDQRGMDGRTLRKTVEAVTRGVPQTVGDLVATIDEAKALDLGGDKPGAASLLDGVRERIDQLADYEAIKKALPNGVHGLTLESALNIAQEGRDGVGWMWRMVNRGQDVGAGSWNHVRNQVEVSAPVLKVTSGEAAYDESFLAAIAPASRTSLITSGALFGIVVTGGAGAAWLAANAAAVAEVAVGAYTAAVALIVRNPYAATAIAEFAASIGFNIIDSGGISNFLERLKTPEGVLQLAMDILVLKQSMGGGRSGAADAEAPDAPRRAPDADDGAFAGQVRDVMDRVRALKGATVEWARQRTPGAQPVAVTPDGATVRVPGNAGPADLPDFSTIYAQQLGDRRAVRAGRGGRAMWPTAEQWENDYQPPPAGKSEVDIRKKLLEAAKEKHPTTDDMPHEQQADAHWKQREIFDRVEARARTRREELEAEAANIPAEDRAWHNEQIADARRLEQAAKVKPIQGSLPINHEFAGKAITVDSIDDQLGNLKLPADTRAKLQRLRKVMVEHGIREISYTEAGYPDFAPFVYEKNGKKADVEIYLRGTRGKDDQMADERFGALIGDPDFEAPKGYTWHHSEAVGRMLLVPRGLHEAFKHTGAIPWYRILTGNYDAYRRAGEDDAP